MAPLPQQLVLDSWPVFERLKSRQPAANHFETLLLEARDARVTFCMSRINYGEVIYGIQKEPLWSSAKKQRALVAFQQIPLEILSAIDARVDQAVALKSRYNISYADAFVAGLAIERKQAIVTGDKEFRALEADGLLEIHWLGA